LLTRKKLQDKGDLGGKEGGRGWSREGQREEGKKEEENLFKKLKIIKKKKKKIKFRFYFFFPLLFSLWPGRSVPQPGE